jgi:hypothetical protein
MAARSLSRKASMGRLASLLLAALLLLLVSHSSGGDGGRGGRGGLRLLSAEGALINAISIVQNQTPLADQLMQAALAAYASVFFSLHPPPRRPPCDDGGLGLLRGADVVLFSVSLSLVSCHVVIVVGCCCCSFVPSFSPASAQCATSRVGVGIENGLPARRCDELVGCACLE